MPSPPKWKLALRALRSRNYRLYFAGQSVSLIGTWMTRIATSWLVYRLTKSPFLLGLVSFAGQAPSFFIAPIAGVWVDRWNRHRTLIVTQILAMLQSFALFALAISGEATVWHVVALMLFQGVINAFDMPARQSFIGQMVDDRKDLPNAIALNSSMVNGSRLIGPAVAGVLIGQVGEAYCFLIDGVSYIAVIGSLLLMQVAPTVPRVSQKRVFEELREGWTYVTGSELIRSLLLTLALVSLLGMPYTTLMPVFATQMLQGGPHTLGILMAASGVGALAGAISLASRSTVVGLGGVISVSTLLLGVSLIGFGFSRSLWLSLPLLLLIGFGMMRQLASSNTILQTIVAEEKRGRVMSFYSMAFQGVAPFGSLLAGALAARIGAPWTVVLSGVCCLLVALGFRRQLPHLRRLMRPIYVELGILPALAEGVQAATAQRTPPQV